MSSQDTKHWMARRESSWKSWMLSFHTIGDFRDSQWFAEWHMFFRIIPWFSTLCDKILQSQCLLELNVKPSLYTYAIELFPGSLKQHKADLNHKLLAEHQCLVRFSFRRINLHLSLRCTCSSNWKRQPSERIQATVMHKICHNNYNVTSVNYAISRRTSTPRGFAFKYRAIMTKVQATVTKKNDWI